jgi:hypothetical protein
MTKRVLGGALALVGGAALVGLMVLAPGGHPWALPAAIVASGVVLAGCRVAGVRSMV